LHPLTWQKLSRARQCKTAGCEKQPVFGPVGGQRVACAQHRETGHQDLSNRKCEHAPCGKHAQFGEAGRGARFCADHRAEEHVDLVNKRCAAPGCVRQPYYGDAAERVARFCSLHRCPPATPRPQPRVPASPASLPRRAPLLSGGAGILASGSKDGHVDVKNRRSERPPLSPPAPPCWPPHP